MPIVVMKEGVHASSQNLSRRQDFPTPVESIRFIHMVMVTRVMYLSLRSAAASPYGLDAAIGTRQRTTYLDEEVVMRRRHDTEPEFTEKMGRKKG